MNDMSPSDEPEKQPSWNIRTAIDVTVARLVGWVIAAVILLGTGALFVASVWTGDFWNILAAGLLFLVVAIPEVWFIRISWRTPWNGEVPFAVAVALQQPPLSFVIRPLAALWWGYQFYIALALGILLALAGRQLPLAAGVLVALLTLTLSYASFVFFLLSVTAFTRRPEFVERVWQWRGWWSLLHGILVFAFKFFLL